MTTIEISMYPFKEGYEVPIRGFIELLNKRALIAGFKIQEQSTCTVICGAYETVFSTLQECIAEANTIWGKAVYVTKIIPEYEAL